MRAVNQPESWWGWHGWDQPQPMSIAEIMAAGTMPPRLAAAFWLGLERGASFVLAADPPGAGKTTILTALLAFAPPETMVYFTRGWGETFALPPKSEAYPTYLLVNEMSDHLPVYSWGPYVVRAFELLAEGYSLATTVHADTVHDVIDQLEQDCDVPRANIGHLTFIVPVAVSRREGETLRRVSDVGLVSPARDGLDVTHIASWDERRDAFSVLEDASQRTALAGRLDMTQDDLERELPRREAFLMSLLGDEASDAQSSVERAIAEFRSTKSS